MSTSLTDEEVSLITNARDHKLRLEALEFACDDSVRSLRSKKLVLDFLSFALAIAFLYLLYIINDRTGAIHNIVSLVGTGVSLLVLVMIVWCHMAKWDGQIEKKNEISNSLLELIEKYEKALIRRPLVSSDIDECDKDRIKIEAKRKHQLATLKRVHIQRGHQHVAMKYSDLHIKCTVCERKWSPELAKRRKWIQYIPFAGCEGCGV